MTRRDLFTLTGIGLLLACVFVFSQTPEVSAIGSESDLQCIGLACPCGMGPGPNGPCSAAGNGKLGCPCFDTTNGEITPGICAAVGKCLGMPPGGMLPMLPMFMPPMKMPSMMMMMMPMNFNPNASTTCYSYYQVTAPSTDPCAIYNPSSVINAAGGSSNVSSGLLKALQGGEQTTSQQKTETPSNMSTTQAPPATVPAAPGLSGDVRVGSTGATIIANLRQGLSEVAGFFGGSTGGASGALSAAGRLCSTRPWSGTFVGNLIPTSFFDGLCEWRGYQIGVIAPTGTSKIPSSMLSSMSQGESGISLQAPESNVPPEVDIWAEPASVRLGTRTYIFWNSRGVVSCKESGPSFSQSSLSGGASTVTISGPTTFTIECLTSASTTVKDSVTVQIAI